MDIYDYFNALIIGKSVILKCITSMFSHFLKLCHSGPYLCVPRSCDIYDTRLNQIG